MKKYLLADFLKWYSESNYLESEIGGKFIDYKIPDVTYTAEQIVAFFLANKKKDVKRDLKTIAQLTNNKTEY